jgi:hypothetical protein
MRHRTSSKRPSNYNNRVRNTLFINFLGVLTREENDLKEELSIGGDNTLNSIIDYSYY